jgi:hypothetical protein
MGTGIALDALPEPEHATKHTNADGTTGVAAPRRQQVPAKADPLEPLPDPWEQPRRKLCNLPKHYIGIPCPNEPGCSWGD